MRSLIFILTLALYFSGSLRGQQLISPDDVRITAGGVSFITRTPDKLVLNRHLPEIIKMKDTEAHPKNAFTQSGVSVSFATNSKHIKVLMEPRRETSLRYGIFGIYKNGVLVNQIKVLPKNNDTFDGISFENPEGEAAEWKVLFPTYYGVDIKGIQIDDGSNFQAAKKPKNGVVTLDEIRKAEADAVKKLQKKGYKNIYLINGSELSGPENLKPERSKDKVHFTVEGAAKFAEELNKIIK